MIFNKVEAAKRKIGNVVSKFETMIDEIGEGVQVLREEISKNECKITDLKLENDGHLAEIYKANIVKGKLMTLISE